MIPNQILNFLPTRLSFCDPEQGYYQNTEPWTQTPQTLKKWVATYLDPKTDLSLLQRPLVLS